MSTPTTPRVLSALVISLAVVAAAYLLGNAFRNRNANTERIDVHGHAKVDFAADLIVWSATLRRQSPTIEQAYRGLSQDQEAVADYLKRQGLETDDYILDQVDVSQRYREEVDARGYWRQVPDGYELQQTLKVESQDLEAVEAIARGITALLDQGVRIESHPPRYYFTQLDSLKQEMLAAAAANARQRAEQIARETGATLGPVRQANQGVYQIVGRLSDESYHWGGAFNTTDKRKTASVTVHVSYGVR